MKKIIGILTAALMLTPSFAVSAERTVPQFDEIISAVPNYPLEHTGDATLLVTVTEETAYQIEIIQHSPERENLTLYDITYTQQPGTAWSFKLEPGSYTVRTTVNATADGFSPQYTEQFFTVNNVDYTNEFKTAEIYHTISLNRESGDNTPHKPVTAELTNEIRDDVLTVERSLSFARYERIRGDYNGDGQIALADARAVLEQHTMNLADIESETPPTEGQIAACDINNNDKLDIEDAKSILDYATAAGIGLDFNWKS